MADFMYLLRGHQETLWAMSPEQMQQTMTKWMEWKDTLEKGGHVKRIGDQLAGSGKVVKGNDKTVTDGPYIEVKDSIAGYMIIEARDMDQAVDLAKGCPILESEGTVEIRPITLQ